MNTTPQTPPVEQPPKKAVIEAKFNPNDPKLVAATQQFIDETNANTLGKQQVEVQPNRDLDTPNPNDTMLTEALIDTSKVDVNETERALFVKSLLNDQPFTLTIELYNGQLQVEIRSRTVHEQRRIFDVLNLDRKDKVYDPEDMAYTITRLQQSCLVLMVRRINGQLFSEAAIPDTASVEEARKVLHPALEKLSSMNQIRWTGLLNAMRVFESKCAKLCTEAANPDFWKPRE